MPAGGMSELMRQAMRMQRRIDQVRGELKDREVVHASASDKVKVTATCGGKLVRIEVDPDFAKTEGMDLTLDAIVAAANGALAAADEIVDKEIGRVTGGLKIPGITG